MTEEGDHCPESGCPGRLEYKPVGGCVCHISPPCSACVTNPLACDTCDWIEEED